MGTTKMNGVECKKYLEKIIDDFNVELLEKVFDVENVGMFVHPKQIKEYLQNIQVKIKFSSVLKPLHHNDIRLLKMKPLKQIESRIRFITDEHNQKNRRSSADSVSANRQSKKQFKEPNMHRQVDQSFPRRNININAPQTRFSY